MSAEVNLESRLSAVRALASLPLFQLSTAGMELFHTNMLYWLATERPDESIAVWSVLGLPTARIDGHTPFIRREWRHIDLIAWPGNDQAALVVENKVGAIPGPAQLDRYYAGLRSARPPFSLESARFVLLTLMPPSFVPPRPWCSMTYRDLLPALRETAQQMTSTDSAIVAEYAELVARLNEVARAYDPAEDLDGPIALAAHEWYVLSESRLLSIVEKARAVRFAQIASEALAALGEAVPVETGFTNGSGIIQSFATGPAGRLFGWQIQGGTFRLAVIMGEHDPHPIAKKVEMAAELYESFFNFELPDHLARMLNPYTGRKVWHRFAPSFVYQHRPLAPEATWNDLLALVAWFSRRTVEYLAALPDTPR